MDDGFPVVRFLTLRHKPYPKNEGSEQRQRNDPILRLVE